MPIQPPEGPTLWTVFMGAVTTLIGFLIYRFSPQFANEREQAKLRAEADLWQRLTDLGRQQDRENDELRAEIAAVRKRQDDLERDNRELRTELELRTRERDEARQQRDGAQGELGKAREEIEALKRRVSDLEQHVRRLEAEQRGTPPAAADGLIP